jgi:prepilin-type N-terminal cleavage/methylation domain-containing protein
MKLGFTLIEMLAVIVLISTIAAIGSVSLVAGGEQARLHEAIAHLKSMDATGRLLGRSGSPTVLVVNDSHAEFLLKDSQDNVRDLATLPRGWTGVLESAEERQIKVEFDTIGRSCDYSIQLRHDTNQRVVALQVCGLTGWVTERTSQ